MVLPIYTGKGDPVECGSYRGIKLLEHAPDQEVDQEGHRERLCKKDCQARNLNREDAMDCGRWKKLIKIG